MGFCPAGCRTIAADPVSPITDDAGMKQGEVEEQKGDTGEEDDDELDPEVPLFDEDFEDDDSDEVDEWMEQNDPYGNALEKGQRSQQGAELPVPPVEAKKERTRRRLKRKRKSRRSELNFQALRPTRMSHAELDKHRREGHVG